jgi:hypothetical protein
VDIAIIRERIEAGKYLIKRHAIQHALKEGFDRKDMANAVLRGTIIEEYSEDQRVLICCKTELSQTADIYLHVVCEHADPIWVEFVTAYIPDEIEWERPPYRRRKQVR